MVGRPVLLGRRRRLRGGRRRPSSLFVLGLESLVAGWRCGCWCRVGMRRVRRGCRMFVVWRRGERSCSGGVGAWMCFLGLWTIGVERSGTRSRAVWCRLVLVCFLLAFFLSTRLERKRTNQSHKNPPARPPSSQHNAQAACYSNHYSAYQA